MAQTAATQLSAFTGFLKADEAAGIFDQAARQSVVQALSPRIPLGINGAEIPVVMSKPSAAWVGEGAKKSTTEMSLGLKSIKPKKIAAISVMSAEVVRANPGGYSDKLREHLAEAFARAFDLAVLHDAGGDGTAGAGPFDNYIDQTALEVELGTATQANGGVYADLNSALKLLVDSGKKLTGFVFDEIAEPVLNAATDTTGRPLFVDATYENTALDGGRVLRRPAFYASEIGTAVVAGTPNTGGIVGYAGDWAATAWGAVGGITFSVSTESSVTINGTLTSLWENNLVAVKAEAEYGWVQRDTASFVKLTNHD